MQRHWLAQAPGWAQQTHGLLQLEDAVAWNMSVKVDVYADVLRKATFLLEKLFERG